jgi:lipopolysaccharide assembly outer membrane protein LptD (OstA)
MRAVMLAIVVLGVGVIGEAQTPAPTRKVEARLIREMADKSLQLRGQVKIQIGNIEIFADEADSTAEGKQAWNLRGNVRMIER